jgi:hypothetical protein
MAEKRPLCGMVVVVVILAVSSGVALGGEEELLWGTYLGGSGSADIAWTVTVDGDGNVYVAGDTDSSDFPTTGGAYDTTHNDGSDAFVSKFSPGGALLWSTYLGGSGTDTAWDAAADGEGNIYVAGPTTSSDFPTTPGAYDTTHNDGSDAFVSKFSPDGALLWSTYLGGSGGDNITSIVPDGDGNIYVAGDTGSSDLPTPGGYDTSLNGGVDIFISKFSANGALLWSTYLGGSEWEDLSGDAITMDGDGSIYVDAVTWSSDFPTTPGAYDTTYNGDRDVSVSKFSANGTLLWSTYLGGSEYESPGGIAATQGGYVYVGGYTVSPDFPFTLAVDDSLQFLTKFSAQGAVIWSRPTHGASGPIVAADGGNVYVVSGAGPGFPTTPDAYDTTYNGGGDGCVSRFNADGTRVWSTYLGGSLTEVLWHIAIDAAGDICVAGFTSSTNFPTPNGYDTSINGGGDAFVVKFGTSLIEWDRDGDGLPDSVETGTGVYVDETDTGTDPDNPDTDGDGLKDEYEVRDLDLVTPGVQNPFDPNDPDSTGDDAQDTPDGVPDGQNDYDGDGMSNVDEFTFGYDPLDANSWAEVPLVTVVGVSSLMLLLIAARRSIASRRPH